MALLTNVGRAALAKMIRDDLLTNPTGTLLAYGTGPGWWGAPQAEQITLQVDGSASLTHPVDLTKPLTVQLADKSKTYTVDDYALDAAGSFAKKEAGTIADGAQLLVSYTADVVAPTRTDTGLTKEVGRCRITAIDFVLPLAESTDPSARLVVVGSGKYALSKTPTRMLLIRARLAEGDAVGDPITEYGLFAGCVVKADLPSGQLFYPPTDLVGAGELLVTETRAPVPHDGSIGLDTSIIFEI